MQTIEIEVEVAQRIRSLLADGRSAFDCVSFGCRDSKEIIKEIDDLDDLLETKIYEVEKCE